MDKHSHYRGIFDANDHIHEDVRIKKALALCQQADKLNDKFWHRLGGKPDCSHLNVLDVGCGLGGLCIDLARSGAQQVCGIDLHERSIAFAQRYCEVMYPTLGERISYRCCDIFALASEETFDLIVSKDTFEHIVNLDKAFDGLVRRLKSGGRMYLAIGPLYYSPFGHHHRSILPLPWEHLIRSKESVLKKMRNAKSMPIACLEDAGLNAWRIQDYERLLQHPDVSIVSCKINQSERLVSKIMNLGLAIPFLRTYFAHNIYCVLEKK